MKNVALRVLSFVVALPAVASCGVTVQPIDVGPGCPEMPLRGPEEFAGAPIETMIDDFEDGELPTLPQLGGRNGSWITTPSMVPPGQIASAEASTRCVARGTHSAHLTSAGVPPYGVSWTALMVAPFGSATPYDASAYRGISFWIAMGDNAMAPFETPIGVNTIDTAMNGMCMPCGDYYAIRKRIPLTRTWTRWVVPFTELRQYGFGNPLVELRKDQLVSLIIWPEPQQVDIWIDDIRFEP
jgi:hypothetical protein